MSTLTRWQASTDEADTSGMATLAIGGGVLAIRLASFADAQALEKLITAGEQQAGDRARKACAIYLRGAVNHIETAQ